MTLPQKINILIVGAGPVGLTTALSLVHHGVRDFIIVDAALSHSKNSSRAITLHAATLEALDKIGCGDDIVSEGIKPTEFNFRTRATKLCGPHLQSLRPYTRHPYILITPQNVTERTLEKKLTSLGVIIHRPLSVVGLKRNAEDPYLSDVIFEDGRVITAKYVIGADGARSTIRTLTGIGFSDPTFVKGEEDNNLTGMVLADVTFDNDSIDDLSMSETLTADNLFLFFPLPFSFNECLAANGHTSIPERVYRIGCGVPITNDETSRLASKEYFQDLLDRFGPYHLSSDPSVNPNPEPPRIKDVVWHSYFRNRASAADATFIRLGGPGHGEGGIVLLIGDAAHIHPPAGGQGMNLGIRDAVFLSEALVKHIGATGADLASQDDTVLRKWATTRHIRALQVIRLSKGVTSMLGMKQRDWFAWWCPIDSTTVRAWGLWVLGCIPFFRNKMAWEFSGLGNR